MKKQVLITVSYIAEIEESVCMEGKYEESLQKVFPRKIKISNDIIANWDNTSKILLESEHNNCNKCTACGSWITDKSKPDYIAGLFSGEYLEREIYCPECAIFARKKLETNKSN